MLFVKKKERTAFPPRLKRRGFHAEDFDDRYFGFYADTGSSGNGDDALPERQTPLETLTGLGTRTPANVQM